MEPRHYLYLLYADLLDYPTPTLMRRAEECVVLLRQENPLAGTILSGFAEWVSREPITHLEETYTCTFDLPGICCPYLGHHLFGDNYQRSWFMAHLNHGYKEKGFSCGTELPDHVAIVLRFLALSAQDEFSRVLLEEGLMPALAKMLQAFNEDGQHPYGKLLRSLQQLLQEGKELASEGLTSTGIGGTGDA